MAVLRHEIEEALADRFADNINKVNEGILKKIGKIIKDIGKLSPSQAYQLAQILKYGGSYEEIVNELSKLSGKSVDEINNLFNQIAAEDKNFVKAFYEYRGLDFIPYSKDSAMYRQVQSIAKQTNQLFQNISNTKGIGYVFRDLKGNYVFKDIQETYNEVIDRAILSISQGKSTYQQEMRSIIQDIGNSGLVQYESGYKRRLDSAVRMNIMDGIRQLQNATTEQFGKEYGADGVEISVHSNPAPDHADIQGRQFADEEYEILESGGTAKDVKGNIYDGADRRQISTYNCYHKEFRIIIGVSQPEYSDKELQKIINDNNKGFEFEGKHYTNYEGTQLQRRIETEIRRQKDRNILAKSSGDKQEELKSETKIRQLTNKYNQLCKVSGLKPKKERMTVTNYKRGSIK